MKSTLVSLWISVVFSTVANAALVTWPEVAVTASRPDVAPFDQAHARLATDLAVWVDHDLHGSGDIHGRFLRDGAPTLVLAASEDDDNRPAIAFGSDRYLVVWSTPAEVRARFVARDGSMSDVVTIASDLTRLARPHVAFNGSVLLVVWDGPGLQFRGAIVDPNGAVVRTFGVATAELTVPEVALATIGNTFYFVSAKIDPAGAVTPNGFPAAVGATPVEENGTIGTRIEIAPATTPVFDLRAAQGSNEFAVAWTTTRGVGGAQVRSASVTAAGEQPVESFDTDLQVLQDLVADGSGYLLIYGDAFEKFVRRMGSNTSTPLATPGVSSVEDAAGKFVLVRGLPRLGFEFGPAGGDLYVARLDAPEYTPLVVAPRHQESPDIAAAGDLRLAVWCEYAGSDRALTVMASRITNDDRVLDVHGLDFGVDVYHPTKPRVASNGTEWFAVWVDARTIYGARIERNGAVTGPFTLATEVFENTDVDIAWDGSTYVVVFTRGMFLRGLYTTVYALRVNPTSPTAGSEIALSSEGPNEQVAIAGGGEGSLTVFRSGASVAATMLSRGGTVAPVFTGVPSLEYPFVAWNGVTFLISSGASISYVNANGVATPTPSGPAFIVPASGQRADGASIVYARRIGHPIRELSRVFVRRVEEASLRRRAVRHGTR